MNTIYEAGLKHGKRTAGRVIDLEYHSEMLRCGDEIPDVESLPLGVDERRDYLRGYAIGVLQGVAE